MIINLRSPIRFARDLPVEKKKKEKAKMDELSYSAILDAWETDWITYTANPDKILAARGWSFYKEIVCDDTVHSCLEIKKTASLSAEWYIEPASEDKVDQDIADFIKYNFDRMSGTFRKVLKDIYSAFEFGFSVSELNWEVIESGPWKGKIGLKSIKTRDPEWIHFTTDRAGNIDKIQQESDFATGGLIDIPRDKVIVYIPKPQFWNPHGRAECLFVYKPYIAKLWTIRFWNIALEKFGMPSILGQYPEGTSQDQKDNLRKALENLQVSPAITLPKGYDVEALGSISSGKMSYESAIDKHNTAISRALLIPDLLGFSEMTKGSYALGKKQFDIFFIILNEIEEDTCENIVDEQLIKLLLRYNFNTEDIPHFKFKPKVEEDKHKIAASWANLKRVGAVSTMESDDKYIRELLGLPFEEDAEKTFSFAAKKPAIKTKAHSVVNFAEIKKTWDDLEKQTMGDLYKVGEKIQADIMKTIERKGLLTDKANPRDIDRLEAKHFGEFKKALEKGMILAYLNSKHSAMKELRELGVDMPVKFAELEATMDLLPIDAIKYFQGKIPIKMSELQYYTQEAFSITGVERERILGKSKTILYHHMHDKKINKTMRSFRKLFDQYIETGELKISVRGNYELLSGYHIENVVRTNIAEAMGQGRRSMYEDPMVRDEIVGYTPSGILDDRQTVFCASIDGRVFPKEGYTFEPYHYMCRTLSLPVMKGETYTYTDWKESPSEGF